MYFMQIHGPNAVVYSKVIGMGIPSAAKSKESFDYSKRGKIDLFV